MTDPVARAAANNSFAAALTKLLSDPQYKPIISNLAQISNLLVRIDSEVPGAANALLAAILEGIPAS
jgi:hypothetical protein